MMSHAAQKDMVTTVDCLQLTTLLAARSLSRLFLQCDSAAKTVTRTKTIHVLNATFLATWLTSIDTSLSDH
jgi:hypothetical protein